MACKCFEEVQKKMLDRVKEQLGERIHTLDEADFGSQVYRLVDGDYCPVMLPFNVRYYKKKKNGEREQRLTNSDTKIDINFCPFCGTKFEGKKSA